MKELKISQLAPGIRYLQTLALNFPLIFAFVMYVVFFDGVFLPLLSLKNSETNSFLRFLYFTRNFDVTLYLTVT